MSTFASFIDEDFWEGLRHFFSVEKFHVPRGVVGEAETYLLNRMNLRSNKGGFEFFPLLHRMVWCHTDVSLGFIVKFVKINVRFEHVLVLVTPSVHPKSR